MFVMNGPNRITGMWDSVDVSTTTCLITLTDDDASFTPGSLRCQFIMPDAFVSGYGPFGTTKQQYLIEDNTANSVILKLCKTPNTPVFEVVPGDMYHIVNYDLRDGSAAIDQAGHDPGPAIDILLRPRPVDVPGIGVGIGGSRNGTSPISTFDIGAFEAQNGVLFVELASFSASTTGAGAPVVIAWETVSEVDNVGFHVYRADANGGIGAKVNGGIIPAKGSETSGASYELLDVALEPGETRSYILEDVDVNGVATLHGPVSVSSGNDGGNGGGETPEATATPVVNPPDGGEEDADGDGFADWYEAEGGTSLGDVNGDGATNQIDSILLYRSVLEGDKPAGGDVNLDGATDLRDALILYRWSVKQPGFEVLPHTE